jgi:hypothetical protein
VHAGVGVCGCVCGCVCGWVCGWVWVGGCARVPVLTPHHALSLCAVTHTHTHTHTRVTQHSRVAPRLASERTSSPCLLPAWRLREATHRTTTHSTACTRHTSSPEQLPLAAAHDRAPRGRTSRSRRARLCAPPGRSLRRGSPRAQQTPARHTGHTAQRGAWLVGCVAGARGCGAAGVRACITHFTRRWLAHITPCERHTSHVTRAPRITPAHHTFAAKSSMLITLLLREPDTFLGHA